MYNTNMSVSLAQDAKEVLKYIDSYWDRIIHKPEDSRGDAHIIPLPYTFIATNDNRNQWKDSMFYWDTFFILRGLVDTKRDWVIPEIVENFVYLFKEFGIIPNATLWAMLDHSQPPFFSSMIFDGYYAIKREEHDKKINRDTYAKSWLSDHIKTVKDEYWNVWEDNETFTHKIEKFGLSRYGDRDVGYALTSERESGWDFTTRFYNRANEFLPVDLNSFLHKYEKDFAKTANILGNKEDEAYWEDRASKRHATMKKFMWNEKEGFFFDYDFVHEQQSQAYSLAGFVPLWAKLATFEEAKRMRQKLELFETDYGLTITSEISLPPKVAFDHVPQAFRHSIVELLTPKQWDYPHIWPPLEYLTVIGLLRYGFIEDAVRIMEKSVSAHIAVFKKYGGLLEKLDATTGEKPKTFWYPTQLGFGWTNAIFYRYIKMLEYIDECSSDIYPHIDHEQPPYSLTSIMH